MAVRELVGIGLGAAAASGYLYAVDPSQPGHFWPCPLYAVTGVYCPACGGLRAVHALLHGDLAAAMDRHPLVIPSLVLALAVLLLSALRRRGGAATAFAPPSWTARWGVALVVLFTVLRNVPGWTWLSPA